MSQLFQSGRYDKRLPDGELEGRIAVLMLALESGLDLNTRLANDLNRTLLMHWCIDKSIFCSDDFCEQFVELLTKFGMSHHRHLSLTCD